MIIPQGDFPLVPKFLRKVLHEDLPVYVFYHVIAEKKPRVNISKTTDARGDTSLLTCKAYPQGRGYFTWLKEGRRIKYNTQATNKLELVSPANGKYQCRGNLTLGSFKYFISNAYVTGENFE